MVAWLSGWSALRRRGKRLLINRPHAQFRISIDMTPKICQVETLVSVRFACSSNQASSRKAVR
jgi:hypothetical protein